MSFKSIYTTDISNITFWWLRFLTFSPNPRENKWHLQPWMILGFPNPPPPNVPSFQPQNSTSVLVHLFFFLVFETALRLKLGGGGDFDLEGGSGNNVSCVGFANFPSYILIPPISHSSLFLSLPFYLNFFLSLLSIFFSKHFLKVLFLSLPLISVAFIFVTCDVI